MEKLVYVAIAIGLLGLVSLLGGGWMLHTAINAGDFYKGVLGVMSCGFGLFCIVPVYGALGH